jgi:hypothetical protein
LRAQQDIRYFFASLVGMLREKSGSVRELHAVIQASVRERLELTRQHRIDQQEDSLLRLKEVINKHSGSYRFCAWLWQCASHHLVGKRCGMAFMVMLLMTGFFYDRRI